MIESLRTGCAPSVWSGRGLSLDQRGVRDDEALGCRIADLADDLAGRAQVGLGGALLFHALNGLRSILVDFWSQGTKRQRGLFWGVVIVWAVLMAGFLPRHLMHMFGA